MSRNKNKNKNKHAVKHVEVETPEVIVEDDIVEVETPEVIVEDTKVEVETPVQDNDEESEEVETPVQDNDEDEDPAEEEEAETEEETPEVIIEDETEEIQTPTAIVEEIQTPTEKVVVPKTDLEKLAAVVNNKQIVETFNQYAAIADGLVGEPFERVRKQFFTSLKGFFNSKETTQGDVDYISYRFKHDDKFSDVRLLSGVVDAEIIKLIVYIGGVIDGVKPTVSAPFLATNAGKLRPIG
jgi:hypothetical protein